MSLTTQRPLPPPPKQTAPSSSTTLPPELPVTPAPEESADVHMADPGNVLCGNASGSRCSYDPCTGTLPRANGHLHRTLPPLTPLSDTPLPLICDPPSTHPPVPHLTPPWSLLNSDRHPSFNALQKFFAHSHSSVTCLNLFLTRALNSTKPPSCPGDLISSGGFSPPPLQVLTLHRPSQTTCPLPP